MILGPVPEDQSFTQTVRSRCFRFLDGEWKSHYTDVVVKRCPPPLHAASPVDAEERIRKAIERARRLGDVRSIGQHLELKFDPLPPTPSVSPVLKYQGLLPCSGEHSNPDDTSSITRPQLPTEVRSRETATPPLSLNVYRKQPFSRKKAEKSCGPSGESPRVWWQCLSLPDEVAQCLADYANHLVANSLSVALSLIKKARPLTKSLDGLSGLATVTYVHFFPHMPLPFAKPLQSSNERPEMDVSS